MNVFTFVTVLISCLLFVYIDGYLMGSDVATFPSECCQCNDSSADPNLWCTSPGVCDHSFHWCHYCQNTRTFDGVKWRVARGCGTLKSCTANLQHTVGEPQCNPNSTVPLTSGTRCYTCCHSQDKFEPHYCRKDPDAHTIATA